MPQPAAPKLLVVTTIPPDLRAALAQRYPMSDMSENASAAGCTVAVTTSMRGFDRALFDRMPELRLIVCNGAGLDGIDLAEARARQVAVCHTPDELAEDVAEAAIALTYAIMRRVAEADRFVRTGRWLKGRMAPSRRVGGKHLGIVGLGRIGRRVAQRAEGIGMTAAYFGRRRVPDVAYPFVPSLTDLAAQADVLVLSCPGGEATGGLVGRDVLARLGPEGYLVNVSRGSVVDEPALLEALEKGAIAGAALDVFAREPDLDPRFAALDNVVLAPHSASITHETRAAMLGRLLGDIEAFLAGRPFHDAAAG
jgi:lactate dehydrogenase-like 2-hydroxyacid dehydrogenase